MLLATRLKAVDPDGVVDGIAQTCPSSCIRPDQAFVLY
jgi:hypothetical protein